MDTGTRVIFVDGPGTAYGTVTGNGTELGLPATLVLVRWDGQMDSKPYTVDTLIAL